MLSESKTLERRALKLSAAGALVMAFTGFGFAALTHSEALMLDGLFSFLGFLMSLGALRISRLVYEPGSINFQFGYAGFEPLFNIIKGMIIVFISLLALYSSVMVILAGGREINIGWALVYAVIVAVFSFIVFGVLHRLAKKTGSPLLKVDAKNWMIDGMITAAVLVGFILTYLARGTDLAWMIPYADPAVVLVLVALSLPVPYFIIRDGVRELLLAAPDAEIQQHVKQELESVLSYNGYHSSNLRIAKTGRVIYIYIFVLLRQSDSDPSVAGQDNIRSALTSKVHESYSDIEVDLLFTRDEQWVGEMVTS